ncbi:MAG: CbtB-domain containing protein [Rhizobiales bacterium]|nr:CbtB-domain containing protein [Hyphomicrobiales bacterium]
MIAITNTVSLSISQRIAAGLALLFVGAVLVFGSGFAKADILHNAAHDTRHGLGFPCH